MALINIRQRVTKDSAKFERFISSDSSVLLSDGNIVEDWSIELTLGDYWTAKPASEPPRMYPSEFGEVGIGPHSSVLIEVKEHLRVPNNMFGFLLPKGKLLLEHGILMATTKIEPRYEGRLRILLYNTTSNKQYLKRGMVIASSVFLSTSVTLMGRELKTRGEPLRIDRTVYQKVRAALAGHFWTIVSTAIAFAALLVSVFKE